VGLLYISKKGIIVVSQQVKFSAKLENRVFICAEYKEDIDFEYNVCKAFNFS
jgi:hypothetical protein